MLAGGSTALGFTFLVTSLGPLLMNDYSTPTRGISQVVGVIIGATVASACALLLVNGFAAGQRIWSRVAPVGGALALLVLGFTWSNDETLDRAACTIAMMLLSIATVLVRTTSFATFVLFRQRLKVRRAVFLENMRSGTR